MSIVRLDRDFYESHDISVEIVSQHLKLAVLKATPKKAEHWLIAAMRKSSIGSLLVPKRAGVFFVSLTSGNFAYSEDEGYSLKSHCTGPVERCERILGELNESLGGMF